MTYAFSRDGALPGSKYWRQVHYGAPVHAIALVTFVAFLLGLPM